MNEQKKSLMCVAKSARVNPFRWKDSLWEECLREIKQAGCVQTQQEQIQDKSCKEKKYIAFHQLIWGKEIMKALLQVHTSFSTTFSAPL